MALLAIKTGSYIYTLYFVYLCITQPKAYYEVKITTIFFSFHSGNINIVSGCIALTQYTDKIHTTCGDPFKGEDVGVSCESLCGVGTSMVASSALL